MRLGRSVATAHRVACDFVAQRRWRWSIRRWRASFVALAFLLPGLVNGYGKIEGTLRLLAERLTRMEATLSTLPPQGSDGQGVQVGGQLSLRVGASGRSGCSSCADAVQITLRRMEGDIIIPTGNTPVRASPRQDITETHHARLRVPQSNAHHLWQGQA